MMVFIGGYTYRHMLAHMYARTHTHTKRANLKCAHKLLWMSPTYQNKKTSSYKCGSTNTSFQNYRKDAFTRSVQNVLLEVQYILGHILDTKPLSFH
jgi:hypothetical protein